MTGPILPSLKLWETNIAAFSTPVKKEPITMLLPTDVDLFRRLLPVTPTIYENLYILSKILSSTLFIQ